MVEKKEIFRKIDGIINELNDQYQYLSKNQEGLNELELELFAASANFLSEQFKIIRKLNSLKESSSPEPPTKITSEESSAAEMPIEHPGEQGTEEKKEPAVTDRKEPESEKKAIQKDIKPEEPEPDESTFSEEVVIRERTISVDIPAQDKLTKSVEHVPTVNDVMSAQRNQSTLGGNYIKQSVTDIKTIINMNDKLLFVKDLFNGYNLAYNEAIELLNRFDNFEAADNFLKNNYAVKNTWAEKQSTVDKFYEILNRRFSK